jgi:hypothetical protein
MPVPFRPAVFACPMRYIHNEKPKKVWPPPYPAWPEIADPSTFYTLPTVSSHPAITQCEWHPKWWDADLAKYFAGRTDRELIYVMFPDDAEEILAKLPPTTENIYEMTLDLLDSHIYRMDMFAYSLRWAVLTLNGLNSPMLMRQGTTSHSE